VFVHGDEAGVAKQLEEVKKYPGINKIVVAKGGDLLNPYGDKISHTLKDVIQKGGYDKVIASTSAFGKDVIPRLGGLIDSQPITDVIQVLVSYRNN